MSDYQIGKDVKELQAQVEEIKNILEIKKTSRPLEKHELSESQKKNLDLIQTNYKKIVDGMNNVLREHGLNLSVASFNLHSDSKKAETEVYKSGGCCCANGWYSSNCSCHLFDLR